MKYANGLEDELKTVKDTRRKIKNFKNDFRKKRKRIQNK